MTSRHYRLLTSICLILLIFLCTAWESFLSPLRPGGSWLILKGAVLLIPLFGVLRGKPYTYRYLSLLIQFYLLEGLVRIGDNAQIFWLAGAEVFLSLLIFIFLIAYLRSIRPKSSRPQPSS